ncbi:hypothetical protein ACFL6D_03640 [Spirochaetota bacterium]
MAKSTYTELLKKIGNNNLQYVIEIMQNRNIRRIDLSDIFSTTKSNVTGITKTLMKKRIIEENAYNQDGKTKNKRLSIRKDLFFTATVEIQSSFYDIRIGIFNAKNECIKEKSIKNFFTLFKEEEVKKLYRIIKNELTALTISESMLSSAVISIPGVVNHTSGMLYSQSGAFFNYEMTHPNNKKEPVEHLHMINSSYDLNAIFGAYIKDVKLYFINRKDIKAYNAGMQNEYKNASVIMFITQFLGIGLLINGNIYGGIQGLCGEYEDYKFYDGSKLQNNAYTWSISRRIHKRMASGEESMKEYKKYEDEIPVEVLQRGWEAQDNLTVELLSNSFEKASLSLRNICQVLMPEYILIEWNYKLFDIFKIYIEQALNDIYFSTKQKRIKIIPVDPEKSEILRAMSQYGAIRSMREYIDSQ